MSIKTIPEQVAEQLTVVVSNEEMTINLGDQQVGSGNLHREDDEVEGGYGLSGIYNTEVIEEIDERISEMLNHVNASHRAIKLDGLVVKFDHPSGVRVTNAQ